MPKFKSSLNIGKQGEQTVREFLEKIGFSTKESSNKEIDLYFTLNGKEYSGEVKWDLYSAKSGNLFIEIFNTKSVKPSGIMTTSAMFWFHMLDKNEIYFCLTSELKNFIEITEPDRKIISGGDNNSTGLLYSKDRICDIVLKPLNYKNMMEYLKI